MKLGGDNDPTQVSRLQAFLHIPVTTVFDAATEKAVIGFQNEYLADTMGPWGVTTPSGEVYITTKAKINELACGTSDALSAADLALINSYKNASSIGAVNAAGSTGTSTNPLSPDVGANVDLSGNATQVAAIGGFASAWDAFWASVWNHIKSAF